MSIGCSWLIVVCKVEIGLSDCGSVSDGKYPTENSNGKYPMENKRRKKTLTLLAPAGMQNKFHGHTREISKSPSARAASADNLRSASMVDGRSF
jgi:hypothetical protein